MSKAQKLVKGISWYFKLGRAISGIVIVLAIVAALLLGGWYLLGDSTPIMLNNLEVGGLSFSFNTMFPLEVKPAMRFGCLMCLFAVVGSVIEYRLYDSVCNILDTIREGRPFQNVVVEQTRRMGWLIIASGVTAIVANAVLGILLPGVINLESVFVGGKIMDVQYTMDGGDINFIIYALVMFLLSAVFQQGAELQQLSDETL